MAVVETFSGACGGPLVSLLDDGSYEIEGRGRPATPVNLKVNGFEASIRKWAGEYGVPPQVVAAVIMRESLGDDKAVSSDNGYGLMQLTHPSVFEGHPPDDVISDPDLNIQLGTKLLGKLWATYKGNPIHVLTSYNAGSPRCSAGKNPWNLLNTHDYVGGTLSFVNGAVDGVFGGGKVATAGLGTNVSLLMIGVAVGWAAYEYARKSGGAVKFFS